MATQTVPQAPAFNPVRYKETTREQWQGAAEAWHRWTPAIQEWLGPSTEVMLDLAGVGPGGRVLDIEGHPMSGVKVTVERLQEKLTTLTDERGEYCFCRVTPGRDYVLRIEREGYARVEERDLVVGRGKLAIRNAILQSVSSFGPREGKGGS